MGAGIRFRFWAFCQFVRDVVAVPWRSSDRGNFVRDARTMFRRAVWHGHLHDAHFSCMDEAFPELGRYNTLASDDTVIAIALKSLARDAETGLRKSGRIPGYLAAERDHLAACALCRAFICTMVRHEMAEIIEYRARHLIPLPDNVRRLPLPRRKPKFFN